ncbi:MAG: SMP-30/gluconolactonase/LRE family protein [Gammaproteobacteria bacterium]|nr:SMP-30/gluconolactonase/LRE family protein [Gammaproteobacteria bacterium]
MNFELIDEIEVHNELGEGVFWDQRRQRIWWTDIVGQRLFRYDPIARQLEQWQTPHRLACFATVAGEDYLIAAFDRGFAYYRPETQRVHWLHQIETDNPGTRLNDGRCDRQGRFWAGSMVENDDIATDKGQLYCLDRDLTVSAWVAGLSITNSLCWSPRGDRMYHCDTPRQRIDQYRFDTATGAPSEREDFCQTDAGCYPDGSTVAADGTVWNAQWGGQRVVRYSDAGDTLDTLTTPARQSSCVAFGGPDLNLLIITSAWQGMSEDQRGADPSAGNLFIYKTPFKGLPEPEFMASARHQWGP